MYTDTPTEDGRKAGRPKIQWKKIWRW